MTRTLTIPICHFSNLDGGADTCVLGQGWEVLSVHNTRRANVVGFDHEAAVKRNLPIVSAITAVVLPDEISVILIVYEAIYNDTANHSLLSQFQWRDFGVKIDSIYHKHGGTQKMEIQDVGISLVVPLELVGVYDSFWTPITNYRGYQFNKAILLDTRRYSMESLIIFWSSCRQVSSTGHW
jgi:hypothetical protein